MNRKERRAAKAQGQLGPQDGSPGKYTLMLSGAPPEEVPQLEMAFVLGMAGQVGHLCERLGLDTTQLTAHFDLPSGKHVCFSLGAPPAADRAETH